MKRTQIYIDDEQDRRLAKRAADLGVTKSELIRTAVDRFLGDEDEGRRLRSFREAVTRTAGVADYLAAGADFIDESRRSDAARLTRPGPTR